MISRRDNLLVRPWQQRRFDNHRKKVQSAKSAIDTRPPLPRQHVILKLKKKQKESERCEEIEKNNFSLLKRLSYVMRTSRVDNYWTTPQPTFLNRVTMYETTPKFENLYIAETKTPPKTESSRKLKCLACTPQNVEQIKIPEERMPWENEKPSISRFRSKSVPVRKPEANEKQVKAPKSAIICHKTKQKVVPSKDKKIGANEFGITDSQRIILSRGCLKLSVNFPSDTLVKLKEGIQEKVVIQNVCHCKNVSGIVA